MARFRAYTSDSSDEGTSSEPENEEQHVDDGEEEESDLESTSGSSSSEMQEEELFTSPSRPYKKPGRNALIEDEDGEIRYAHEVEDEQRLSVRVSPASSSSSPPPPRNRGDSTMIPWAQHVGVDAQKMHVMQTSLFRMPEEAAALRTMNQQNKPNLRVPQQPLSRKHSRDSDGDGLRFEPRERASFAHNIDPPAYRPSRKYARVESSESAVKGNEGVVVDAGLALGRSFRVGWGPGGTLVHLGKLCGPSSTIKVSANSATITTTTFPTTTSTPHILDLSSKLLQHHLSNSPIEPDDDGIPFAAPSSTLNFASFASLFPSTDRSYEASVFRLGEALFDEIDLHLGSSITVDIRNRVVALRRKAALSAWLEDAVVTALEADLRSNPSASSPAIAFTYLTGNQVDKACAAAMDGGFLKLATLISQAGGDFDFREDLKEQLQIWRDQRIDVHIDEGVRKVYALLSGIVDEVVEGSKGGGLEKCSDADVTKGLDWKRVFGLHLWFSEPVDAPIAQVFGAYDRLTKNTSRQIGRPVPWYTEQGITNSSSPSWNLPSQPSLPDGLYSLIRLHAEPACSLSQILSPLSFGSSPVDYSLAWHLYIILSRCMGVRDFADRGEPLERGRAHRMMDDSEEDQEDDGVQGHSPSADLLASTYAFQLEGLGMIQEALFVLLHIESPAGREKAIKDLLARSASKLDEWMTRGIVGSLKIPMAWVNEAKAMYALDKGDVYDAYQLFISAGLYNLAHDLAVLELAPDAVIRRDLELLKEIFNKFVGRPVDGWHIRGQVFLDYVHVMTRLPELQAEQTNDAVVDASQATEIDDLARSVPKLIGILPDVLRNASDVRHRAALSVMVAGLTTLVDKIRPLALSSVQPMLVDETTKLRHIHSLAFARFQSSFS